MSTIGFSRMAYEVDFKLSANFTFQTSHIYTVSAKQFKKLFSHDKQDDLPDEVFGIKIPARKERNSEFGYLIIDTTFDLEGYDSLTQGAAKKRPDLLIIQGILSFLTGHVFISFQNFSSQFDTVPYHIESGLQNIKLVADKNNLSTELRLLLSQISKADSEKKILIFTMLERWRKALHFEVESDDNYLYTDEATLAYVHVLEVLSDEFKKSLGVKIKDERKKLISQILNCSKSTEPKNIKILNGFLNQLNQNQVTLRTKLLNMLKDLNIYDLKSEAIVVRYIDHRNAIAHGRKNLYQDNLVFPLKPFFSFIKDINENLESIKILSAKCISSFLELNVWDAEWQMILLMEPTPFSLVQNFLQTEKHKSISTNEFMNGKIDSITPETLIYFYIYKKIKFAELEANLTHLILSAKLNKKTCQILFNAAAVLSDSQSLPLADKCKEIIRITYKNKWYLYSNIRDILKEFEYYELRLTWYGEWLLKKD
jgi:hypothetical protein